MHFQHNDYFFHPCRNCGAAAILFHVKPLDDSHEARSYECHHCGRIDAYDVSSDPSRPWMLLEPPRSNASAT